MNSSFISRFKNTEYIQYFIHVLQITENYNAEALNIQAQLACIKRVTDDLFLMVKRTSITDLTKTLVKLDLERGKIIRYIRNIVMTNVQHYDTERVNMATPLRKLFLTYGDYIDRLPYAEETLYVNKLLDAIRADKNLTEQAEALGLTPDLLRLEQANQVFDDTFVLRTRLVGSSSGNNIRTSRKELSKLFQELLILIDASIITASYKKAVELKADLEILFNQAERTYNLRISRSTIERASESDLEIDNQEIVVREEENGQGDPVTMKEVVDRDNDLNAREELGTGKSIENEASILKIPDAS